MTEYTDSQLVDIDLNQTPPQSELHHHNHSHSHSHQHEHGKLETPPTFNTPAINVESHSSDSEKSENEHGHTHSHSHSSLDDKLQQTHKHDEHEHHHDHEDTHEHNHYHSNLDLDLDHDHDDNECPQTRNFLSIESITSLLALPAGLICAQTCLKGIEQKNNIITLLLTSLTLAGTGVFVLGVYQKSGLNGTHERNGRNSLISNVLLLASLFSFYVGASELGAVRATMLLFVLRNENISSSNFYLNLSWKAISYIVTSFLFDIFYSKISFFVVLLSYGAILFLASSLWQKKVSLNSNFLIPLGLILAIPSILFVWNTIELPVLLIVSVGSCSVFLISQPVLIPSRFNAATSGFIGTVLEWIIGRNVFNSLHLLFSILSIIISPSKRDIDEDERQPSAVNTNNNKGKQTVLNTILSHSDTRNIFYFLLLNFSFMLIQLLYSVLSHSLGLLSDSIHMFIDCLALMVGLVAGVLSKYPPSTKFPYGLNKIEVLSGFANGCLLIGISTGILVEGIERIIHPVKLQRTRELLVVSVLGLIVNLVGIFAFNHGDGHGHGHSHGSGHSHSHSLSHSHSHAEGNDDCNSSAENENMKGILLHIMADTLGSVGVVVSTLLTNRFGWNGFDPLASLFIGILIAMSAIPLIQSTSKSLLLSNDSVSEASIRDVLNDISTTPGVQSYSEPRFWNDGNNKLCGSIHIIYIKGFGYNSVKNKILEVLENRGFGEVFIQMESDNMKDLNIW